MSRKTIAESLSAQFPDDEMRACAEEMMAETPAAQRVARTWISARVWRVLSVVSVVVILAVSAFSVFSGRVNALTANSFSELFDFHGSSDFMEQEMSSYSERERILLEYDSSYNDLERWRPLYELEPTNPVYFTPYFLDQVKHHGDLSPEMWETITERDPENGIYDLMKISHEFTEKYPHNDKRSSLPKEERKNAPSIIIDDRKAFKKDLEHLRAAYKKGSIDTYWLERHKERVNILPESEDYLDHLTTVTIKASASQPFVSDILGIANFINLQAEETEDETKLLELAEISEWIIQERLKVEGRSLVDTLVTTAIVVAHAETFSKKAEHISDEVFNSRKKRLQEQMERYRYETRENPEREKLQDEIRKEMALRGDLLSNLFLTHMTKASLNVPEMNAERMRAGQRMEQAFIMGKVVVRLLLLILSLVAVPYFIFTFILPKSIRAIGSEVSAFYSPKTLLLISFFSGILPLGCFFLARYFFSFGALDYGVYESIIYGAPHHYNVFWYLLFLMLYSPFYFADVFSPLRRRKWHHTVLLVLLYLGLFLSFTASPGLENWEVMAEIHLWLLGGVLLLFLMKGTFTLFSPLTSRLNFMGKVSLILPSYAVSALLLLTLSLFFSAEERHWGAQDNLLTTPYGGSSYYEDLATRNCMKDLRALMAGEILIPEDHKEEE